MVTANPDMTDLVALDLSTNISTKKYLPIKALLVNKPEYITLVINNRLVDQNRAEEMAAVMEDKIKSISNGEIKVRKHCGGYDARFVSMQHVLLVATHSGWYIDKARGVMPQEEVVGHFVQFIETEDTYLNINVNKTEGSFTQTELSEEEKLELAAAIDKGVAFLNEEAKKVVQIGKLLKDVQGRSILIQRINDERYSAQITGHVLDMMHNIFDREEGHKVTVITLNSDQKSKISDYLTNSIVVTVYPGSIIVDKAVGTEQNYEGKKVILEPHIVMTSEQYVQFVGKIGDQ